MNVLDEDIDAIQCKQLEAWKIHFRRIGFDVGWLGMKDRDNVIPLLHSLRHPTFFSRDQGFYHSTLRHHLYCLVYLDVLPDEAAKYVRRFLRHNSFRAQAQRMGKVVRVRHGGLSYWQVGIDHETPIDWDPVK